MIYGDCFLASESNGVRLVALPQLGLSAEAVHLALAQAQYFDPASTLVTLGEMWASPIAPACAAVTTLLSALAARPAPRVDQLGPANQDRGPPLGDAMRDWATTSAWVTSVDGQLHEALTRAASADPRGTFLLECAGRIIAPGRPLADGVPVELRGSGDPVLDSALDALPFSRRYRPTVTAKIPAPGPQAPQSLQPRSFDQILTPASLHSIRGWLTVEANNFEAMRRHGPAVTKRADAIVALGFGAAIQPHGTLVVGQDGFLPAARGVIWDCRPFEVGLPAEPLRFDTAPHSSLNAAYIQSAFTNWPDQEIVGLVTEGVQFQATMPLQFVFSPQLSSLANAVHEVGEQIEAFIGEGLFNLHRVIPFAPAHFMPSGAAAKKGTNKWRRTSDGGAPRRETFDGEGVRAPSINEGIGLKDPRGGAAAHAEGDGDGDSEDASAADDLKWRAQEIKPRVADAMYDNAILRRAGLSVLHEPLLGFTDDFARFFNQVPLHPSEYWLVNHLWPHDQSVHGPVSAETSDFGGIGFVSERRLGFGLTISSNVGQRLAEMAIADFEARLEAVEQPLWATVLSPTSSVCVGYSDRDRLTRRDNGWTDACRWVARRRTLSRVTGNNELKAYAVKVYTDDIVLSVLGNERMIRALACWHDTTRAFGLEMAAAHKRQLGTSITWLGFQFYMPTGIVAVTPEKIVKARLGLDAVLHGTSVTFGEYRALVGLLEHLLVIVGGDRTNMYHMYGDNFRRGSRFGAATVMLFEAAAKANVARWSRVLLTHAGSFFSAALSSSLVQAPPFPAHAVAPCAALARRLPPPEPTFFLFSDAAAEDTFAGLGGWVHGDWWHIELSVEDRELFHITALEMIALGINVIMFGEKMQGAPVALCSDALATVNIVNNRNAHSPALQAVHELILALPELALIAPTLSSVHVFGEVNIMADASSRARFALIDSVARQLSVPHRRVEPPARALVFLDAARNDARTRRAPTAPQAHDAPSSGRSRPADNGIARGAAIASASLGVARADAMVTHVNTSMGSGALAAPSAPPAASGDGFGTRRPSRRDPERRHRRRPLRVRWRKRLRKHSRNSALWREHRGRAFSCTCEGDGPWPDRGGAEPSRDLGSEPSGRSHSTSSPIFGSRSTLRPSSQQPPARSFSPIYLGPREGAVGGNDRGHSTSSPIFASRSTHRPNQQPPTRSFSPIYLGPREGAGGGSDRNQSTPSPVSNSRSSSRHVQQPPARSFSPIYSQSRREEAQEPSTVARGASTGAARPRPGSPPSLWTARPSAPSSPVFTAPRRAQAAGGGRGRGPKTHHPEAGPSAPPPFPLGQRMDPLQRPDPQLQGCLSPLVAELQADVSDQALRPTNPGLFTYYDDLVGDTVSQSVPIRTAKKNKGSWKLWEEFTSTQWGTKALRDDCTDAASRRRESFLVSAFVIWLQASGKVKARAKNRTLPKPKTLMGHVYAVRRTHVLNGHTFHQFNLVNSVLHTLSDRYCSIYGNTAAERKEPLSRQMLKTLLATASGLKLSRGRTLNWDSWFGINLAASMAVSSSGGFRKGEIALEAGAAHTNLRMSRASLFWIIQGCIIRCPTEAQLAGLEKGDKAGLLVGPCKNDPWGEFFAPHPLYFGFDSADPDNTALRLRTLVLACPVEPGQMKATPLFSSSPSFESMRHNDLDDSLKVLLRHTFGPILASNYSWHSFRIGLACALLAAGAPESTILALCRWRSPSSLRIYARLSFDEYASWLEAAETQDVQAIQGPNLPPLPAATRATMRVPGTLGADFYEALEGALTETSALTTDELRALADKVPEIDPDDFVAELAQLAADEPGDGASSPDEDNE